MSVTRSAGDARENDAADVMDFSRLVDFPEAMEVCREPLVSLASAIAVLDPSLKADLGYDTTIKVFA